MTDLIKDTLEIWDCITNTLFEKNITISTMENITGGLIASLITNAPCTSKIFPGSYVIYDSSALIKSGVDAEVIEQYGVYSVETAIKMAQACRKKYNTKIGIGVTGLLTVTGSMNVYAAISTSTEYRFSTIIIPDTIDSMFKRKMYVAKNTGMFLYNMCFA